MKYSANNLQHLPVGDRRSLRKREALAKESFLLSRDNITRQYSRIMPLSATKGKKRKEKAGKRVLDQPDQPLVVACLA